MVAWEKMFFSLSNLKDKKVNRNFTNTTKC